VSPVNLLVHPVLLAFGSHYIGYQIENICCVQKRSDYI